MKLPHFLFCRVLIAEPVDPPMAVKFPPRVARKVIVEDEAHSIAECSRQVPIASEDAEMWLEFEETIVTVLFVTINGIGPAMGTSLRSSLRIESRIAIPGLFVAL
jgi:hypothetical protein